MTCCAELADCEWLTGAEAGELLVDLAGRAEPLHAATARLRKQHSAARAHLLLEQAELRQRATAKFDRAAEMFFTRLGLEQATDQWIAAYKARRFAKLAGRGQIADFCCGIGGDLVALAGVGATTGLDRDEVAACYAAANARGAGVSKHTSLQTCELDLVDADDFAAWHIDPDRRPSGNRTTSLEWSSPGLEVIERLLSQSPHAAIKLAPGADVPAKWTDRCEFEWISRDRQCRQLVAWHGDLAQTPGMRCATQLSSDGSTAESFAGEPNEDFSFAALDRFLFEPDAAVLAAHLGGALARSHGLSAISAGIAYLTGPEALKSPLLACFEVDSVLPLDLRKINDALRARRIGRLEIKKRGVDHDPEAVRQKLHLEGEESASLFLTKLASQHTAILARRLKFAIPTLTSDL